MMGETLYFRCITYDSVLLDGKLEYFFFSDSDDILADRTTKTIETDLVRWIFQQQNSIRYLFHEELDISNDYHFYLEVRKPIIKDDSGPGDIDILMVNHSQPHLSIAFQVKRIKGVVSDDDVTIFNTNTLPKGVSQSKFMLSKYRFHQNYLMLVVVTDTHKRTKNDQMFRYPTLDEKQVIYRHPSLADFPEEVGIYTYEINQPSINHTNETGVLLSKKLKEARLIAQSDDTTERIKKMLVANGTML